jgi:hypothetical protein
MSHFAVIRYNTDGSLDMTFDGDADGMSSKDEIEVD